ncbi:hypothetical protein LBW59_15840 [Ralstonia solanacearum]|uniref:Phage protein n=1 Tax=Ralstonia solanacearum TaxID=305 RepID=A0AAW5ZS43_RALSL|nr:hypothetical protein [Ralstonia solanacearum]MDB0572233.1 hypothetical protein [Ralstonia solanacearum]
MKLTVQDNIAAATAAMRDRLGNQLPYAAARALTRTARQAVKPAIIDEMRRVFDRPTPYTLNALYVRSATKAVLEASVGVKDEVGKGTAQERYLDPQVRGGGRNVKRFESMLRSVGALPADMFLVPGGAAKLDQYGNVSRGQIVEILAYLQAFSLSGFKANSTPETKARRWKGRGKTPGYAYFVLSKPEGKLPAGIYKRINYGASAGHKPWRTAHLAYGGAKPVFVFVRQPAYRKRLPFNEVAERVARARLPEELMQAAQEALGTAK